MKAHQVGVVSSKEAVMVNTKTIWLVGRSVGLMALTLLVWSYRPAAVDACQHCDVVCSMGFCVSSCNNVPSGGTISCEPLAGAGCKGTGTC